MDYMIVAVSCHPSQKHIVLDGVHWAAGMSILILLYHHYWLHYSYYSFAILALNYSALMIIVLKECHFY